MVADEDSGQTWTGIGIVFGAALGLVVGLVGWGADGIALGMVFGTAGGLLVGAAVDGMSDSSRRR